MTGARHVASYMVFCLGIRAPVVLTPDGACKRTKTPLYAILIASTDTTKFWPVGRSVVVSFLSKMPPTVTLIAPSARVPGTTGRPFEESKCEPLTAAIPPAQPPAPLG